MDTTFPCLKSFFLNPKSNVHIGYIYKSALILPSLSFDPDFLSENLFLRKLLLILKHLFYHIWLHTVSKGTRKEEVGKE